MAVLWPDVPVRGIRVPVRGRGPIGPVHVSHVFTYLTPMERVLVMYASAPGTRSGSRMSALRYVFEENAETRDREG